DRRLASGTGEQSIAWMSNATTLQQMPLGLVSVAIALAALPRLSQYFALGQENAYRSTLADGLRLVTLLIVPAAVGLWLLGEPVVRLLFERNRFLPADTVQVAAALNIYVVGMLFAAVDFPLNYAFYARQNTLLPALVGVLSVGVYVAVALSLLGRMGYLGLVWADTAKQASHAAVMLGLMHWKAGGLDGRFVRAFYPIGLAALVMAAVIIAVQWVLAPALAGMGRWADPVVLAAGGGIGAAVYLGLLLRMRLPEAGQLLHTVRRRVK
ncbi:MAG: lipid II flippase MurJ, partial [Chloroflexota bacterium]|nr:lipid II flippase MurJ [Chloroflexota bacterium]